MRIRGTGLFVGAIWLAAWMVAGCGGSQPATAEAPEPAGTEIDFYSGGVKTTCPGRITGEESRSTCKLEFEKPALADCNGGGPGGSYVQVVGISCSHARQLRLPLGGPGFDSYMEPREDVYRPWLAEGGHLAHRRQSSKPSGLAGGDSTPKPSAAGFSTCAGTSPAWCFSRPCDRVTRV